MTPAAVGAGEAADPDILLVRSSCGIVAVRGVDEENGFLGAEGSGGAESTDLAEAGAGD
jgi:hypothetical protein